MAIERWTLHWCRRPLTVSNRHVVVIQAHNKVLNEKSSLLSFSEERQVRRTQDILISDFGFGECGFWISNPKYAGIPDSRFQIRNTQGFNSGFQISNPKYEVLPIHFQRFQYLGTSMPRDHTVASATAPHHDLRAFLDNRTKSFRVCGTDPHDGRRTDCEIRAVWPSDHGCRVFKDYSFLDTLYPLLLFPEQIIETLCLRTIFVPAFQHHNHDTS